MSERDFKGIWLPKEIWFSTELSPIEKLLYIEIDSLDKEFGCVALNKHFSDFLGISTKRVSELINGLTTRLSLWDIFQISTTLIFPMEVDIDYEL